MNHTLSRRGFLSLLGSTPSLLACGVVVPTGALAGAASASSAAPAAALTCDERTRKNPEGPFFTPGSPERRDIRDDQRGIRLTLRGRVIDTNCQPVAHAKLDFWQANAQGEYDLQGYALRGHQFTDADGRYELDTIVPSPYHAGTRYRPAHIHVKVEAIGLAPLTTQLYFPDDPHREEDPFFDPELVLDVRELSDDEWTATFDFILAPR